MRKALTVFAAGMVALAGGGCFSPSMATPTLILDPSNHGNVPVTLTDGNLLISVTSCSITIASANSLCGAGNNLYLTASNAYVNGAPTTTAVIQSGIDGSGWIFSASAHDQNTYDLSVTLTVQTVDHAARLVSTALAVNGSADTSSNLALIGTGESVLGQSFQSLGSLTGTAAGPVQSVSFAGQNMLTLIKDISDKTAGAPSGTGNMTLTSVSQTWGQVPEPASIALLLTGIASLGVLRRRRPL